MDETTSLIIDDGVEVRRAAVAEIVAHADRIDDARAVVGRDGPAVPVRSIMTTELPWVTVSDATGSYRASIPSGHLMDAGYLLVGSSDVPLSTDDGGPLRLVVVDGSTLCWNVKHVGSLRATPSRERDSVPVKPPH